MSVVVSIVNQKQLITSQKGGSTKMTYVPVKVAQNCSTNRNAEILFTVLPRLGVMSPSEAAHSIEIFR